MFNSKQYENSWGYVNCLSVLVWKKLQLADVVILAEVYQCCTALNGKQRPRPVLYYSMALIKTRLVCLWLVLTNCQFLLRDTSVYAVRCMHLCSSLRSLRHLLLLTWRWRRVPNVWRGHEWGFFCHFNKRLANIKSLSETRIHLSGDNRTVLLIFHLFYTQIMCYFVRKVYSFFSFVSS